MRHLAASICLTLLTFGFAEVVSAQEGADQGAAPAAGGEAVKSSAAVTLVEFERVMTDAACDAKAIKDPRFVADAKNAIRPLIHAEDSKAMLTNKKHVVMAYAAILVLLVGFVVFLSIRQRKLSADIEQLRDDLDKAASE